MFDDVIFNYKFITDEARNLLDPCAGIGSIIRLVRNRYPWLKVTAVEKDRCFADELAKTGGEVIFEDFLSIDTVPMYDRIMCRPPPNKVKDYVRHGFHCLKPDGPFVHLVSMQFVSANREFLQEIKPNFVYSIPRRYDIGAELYAWIVWHRNPPIPITLFDWLF